MRINLLAVGATVASMLLCSCETMQAIDRGLYAATEAVTEKDRVTGARSVSLADRKGQIAKGNQAVEQYISQAQSKGKRLNADYDQAAFSRITRIFNQLHQVSHLKAEQWTPVLIEDDAWNAFTTGGTYFVINSALERDLTDDSELANVVAHEMAHTVANHGFERLGFLQLNKLGGSASADRDSFQAAFTHENEAEADRIAVLYCALAGFDPDAGSRIWARMHRRQGNDALFVHDHPMNEERAVNARKTAQLVRHYYTQGRLNPAHAEIIQSNELFTHRDDGGPAGGEGGGILAALSAGLQTYQQKQTAKQEEQRQQYRIQFMQGVERVSTLVNSYAIGSNQWRFTVHYQGNIALTDLSFKALVNTGAARPLAKTQQLSGVLKPNTTFSVDFRIPELDTRRLPANQIQLIYDNARAAQ